MNVLLVGDTHIPERADKIPGKLLEIIEQGKPWDVAVFTGDFTSESVYRWFLGIGRKVFVVRGNMDYLPLPKTQVFNLSSFRVGVHHGDGVYPRGDTKGLTRIADRLGVQILMTGHTHSPFIKYGIRKDLLLLNPGSLTGVWGGGGGSMKPSMIILDVFDDTVRVELYELSRDHRRLDVIEKIVIWKNNIWAIS